MFCEILFLLIEIEFSFSALFASLTDFKKLVSVARRLSTSISSNIDKTDIQMYCSYQAKCFHLQIFQILSRQIF